ncbi:MAG: hypothetical protein D6768_12945 [Chloroflexi bacterium]|nr:MAG: hypothetical protein D6768_12945 [Chloroflexota bacterium]
MLGLAAVQINFVVTTILAAGLSAGSLTALNYGWIIMLLPQGIIAQSVATALFPTLAALVAEGNRDEMRRIFLITLRNLLFLTLPAAAGLAVLRVPLVRLLLERGAFTAESTQATALALGFFALGLTGHAVVEIAARAFYALKNTKTPVGVGIAAMVVNVLLSVTLLRVFAAQGWPPHGGLALANAVAILLEMVVLLALLRRPLGGLSQPGLGVSLLKMAAAAAAMGVALAVVLPILPENPGWLAGVLGVALGGGVYLAAAWLLRLDELLLIQRKILGRLARW